MIHARVKEIMEMVNEEIEISGYKNKLNLGIVLTGGGAQLKDLSHLVEYTTHCEVKIGLPDPHLGKGLVEEVRSPMYATCIGLVLQGFEGLKEFETEDKSNNIKKTTKSKPSSESGMFRGFLGSFRKWIDDDQSMDDFK